MLSSFRPHDDDAIADHFAAAREFEQQATMIREFALSYVPGILQTKGYAHAVMRTSFPPWSEEERDKGVVSRLERAKILDDPVTPVVWALLDEAVLRRPIGDPAVMAEQLMHIVRLAEVERVRVHVIPFGLGAYPLLQAIVKLMWFEDQPPVAYSEAVQSGKVYDTPAVVEQLQARYHLALGDALPLKESVALIRATAKEYGDHD